MTHKQELFLDMEYLTEVSNGNKEIEKKYLEIFIKQAKRILFTLAKNSKDGEIEKWYRTIHLLKGSASSLGARTIYSICEEAKNNSKMAEEKRQYLKLLKKEIKKIQDYYSKNWPDS